MAAGTKQVTQLEFSVQIIYVAEEQAIKCRTYLGQWK
jgi:hypothetical protein